MAAALIGQLALLGYQIRADSEMSLLRAWVVGAVSPMNQGLHWIFSGVSSSWRRYVWLVQASQQNESLKRELVQLKLENSRLQHQLERWQREQRLVAYQAESASKTILAEVIGGGANAHAKEILLNLGRRDGVVSGMAVITADGIAGKVVASYPRASLAVLINDRDSGVGVILEDTRVRGVLRGRGSAECLLDYVEHETPVRPGEIVYTSGDDRVFPKGLRVGEVTRIEEGADFQQIWVRPFAPLDRLDEVLVVLQGVHGEIPSQWTAQPPEVLLPFPAPQQALARDAPESLSTDADRIYERYRAVIAAQGVRLGRAGVETTAPDFNLGHPSSDSFQAVEGATAEVPAGADGLAAGAPASRPQ